MAQVAALLAVMVGLFAAGCGRPEPPPAGRPVVAVTLFPLGDVVREVAGPDADVVVILPAGASPATFEPPPDLVRRLAGARLVIAVGAGADDWAAGPAHALGAPLLTLTGAMTLQYGHNPHVWLDPILVRDAILPQVTAALVRVIPAAEPALRTRAAEYRESLTALDAEIRATLSTVESRAFVATHPAWPYFASRYGLRQVGVLYPSPGRELTPREFAALVDEARRAGVRAVFTEPQLGDTGVRALADELGAQIGVLDPLGGPALADRNSYIALLRFDARALARTLGGQHE
jgi:zinc transport system substrate-binding protein